MRFLVPVLCLLIAACASGESQPSVCDTPGAICTWAGIDRPGKTGDGERPHEATLYFPMDVAFHTDGTPYIVDWNNHRIRSVSGGLMTTVVGTGIEGDLTFGPATESMIDNPTSVAVDAQGRVTIAAWHNSYIVRYDPKSGELERICGDGSRTYVGEDGPALDSTTDLPSGVAFDYEGRLLIVDQANQRIRRIGTDGVITSLVGTGEPGYGGDDGPATEAQIHNPVGQTALPAGRVVAAPDGTLFFADTGNHRVRRISPDGIITTLAGTGSPGFSGEGTVAAEAQLNEPRDVEVDEQGRVYIADASNHCVRVVDQEGLIHTFAGQCGLRGDLGDGGDALEAKLDRPYGLAFDPWGRLFVVDTYNHRIRVVAPLD